LTLGAGLIKNPASAGFFIGGVAQNVAQNDLKQTGLDQFGSEQVKERQQKRCGY